MKETRDTDLLNYLYLNRKYMSNLVKSQINTYKSIDDTRKVKGKRVVDMHTHIMPDIDDGSRGLYESIELLNLAIDKGITDVFLTPHSFFIHDDIYKRFDDFKREIEKFPIPIRLYLGCEVLSRPCDVAENIGKLITGEYPTMNGTKCILIEPYPYDIAESDVKEMIKAYKNAGFIPIVAHVDRYTNVTSLKGELLQSNADEYMGDKGRISFIGSDCHQIGWREPNVIDKQEKYTLNCKKLLNI